MKYKITTGLGVIGIISIFYLIFFSNTTPLYGSTCKYEAEIIECRDSQGGKPRELGFECPQDPSLEFQAFQVVLDKEFEVLDNEIAVYLDELQLNKSQYYGAGVSYLDGYDDITKKLGATGEYWEKYNKLCNISNPDSITQQTLACLKREATITTAFSFFKESDCSDLVLTKLSRYKIVAENILYLNKAQTLTDAQQGYTGEEKNAYGNIGDLSIFNLGMIQKISNKWVSKNKKDGMRGG